MIKPLHIYWSRRDFRTHDNPALHAAVHKSRHSGGDFLPLFVIEDYMISGDPAQLFGVSSREALIRCLPDFVAQFQKFIILQGRGAKTIQDTARHYKKYYSKITIHVNDDVYPDFRKQAQKIKDSGIDVIVHSDRVSVPINTVSGTGNTYTVFTPFKHAVWKSFLESEVLSRPHLAGIDYADVSGISSVVPVDELRNVFPDTHSIRVRGISGEYDISIGELQNSTIDYDQWYWNESDAIKKMKSYIQSGALLDYGINRDSLEIDALGQAGTSKLSIGLAWGMISARQIKQEILEHHAEYDFLDSKSAALPTGVVSYLSELIWREFYGYIMHHHPTIMNNEFQKKYQGTIQWESDTVVLSRFTAWIQGVTGYPIVDAAMQQIAQTGWMHNRSRMIVASILTKNLGVDWRWGQEYFRAMLVDIDESSNSGGWQWGASVGADPKPIRIFNPELQAKNYDASGEYQRKWLGDDRYYWHPVDPIVSHADARVSARRRYGLSDKEVDAVREY
jgi:deoxyribodipyrimidine photo-lyase